MQHQCYRCGNSIEEQVAFCPACGAPQIRVARPADPLPETQSNAEPIQDPFAAISDLSANPLNKSGIAWKSFARTAAPLAAFTGIIALPIPPLSLFVLLPTSVILAIYIYRRHRPGPLRRGHGARMGAVTGLLTFFFFAVFLLVGAFLNPAKYSEIVAGIVQQMAARNPDPNPQTQQMLQWFGPPHGIAHFTTMYLVEFLIFFMVISSLIGALAVALGKPGNNRQL